MATKKKEILPVRVEPAGLPAAIMSDVVEDVGKGAENIGAEDMAISFLTILQALSPQVTDGRGTVGQLYDTVSGEVYDRVTVIPCGFNKAWVEWIPRDQGGGFVCQHPTDQLLAESHRDEKNNDVLKNGNHLVQTAYHYCLLIKPSGDVKRVVVGMTRTQLKKSRKWNTVMRELRLPIGKDGKFMAPPTFAYTYELTTENETNKRGQTYRNFSLGDPALIQDRELYLAARGFHDEVSRGTVVVTPPMEDDVGETPVTESNIM